MVLRMTDTAKHPEPDTARPVMLTLPEAAKQLRVSVRALRDWVAQGELLVAQPGKRLLVPQSEVDRLLTPRRHTRTSA